MIFNSAYLNCTLEHFAICLLKFNWLGFIHLLSQRFIVV